MEHTPEPWHSNGRFIAGESDNMPGTSSHIATCGRVDGPMKEKLAEAMGEANARRIVACVNACAGFTTEELEVKPDILELTHNDRT